MTDVLIAGAGAAGLMAAIRAAERGRRTLLLEKNRKPGVKILMSGGTRCNITHATDNRGIVAAYGPSGKFLHSALAAFSVQDTLDFFATEGVATKVEETGKIFPVSNRAVDVLNALLRRLERSGATLALSEPLRDVIRADGGFSVVTATRTIFSPKVIITTGGQSYPGSGTTGDGYHIAAKFGHTIVPPRPALVPITVDVPWTAELRGITLPDTGVKIIESFSPSSPSFTSPSPPASGGEGWGEGGVRPVARGTTPLSPIPSPPEAGGEGRRERTLITRRGSLLFAHFGLSGPVILDVSRVVSGHPQPRSLQLELDFLPGVNEPELDEYLRLESLAQGKKQLAVVLAERLPRRLCDALLAQSGPTIDRRAAGLSKADRAKLVAAIKRLRLPVTGTLGFGKAEVTAGGVALSEVDSRDMQSKLVPGLYFAGEVLDLDGPIGGFNFQAAWSTGWLAGGGV